MAGNEPSGHVLRVVHDRALLEEPTGRESAVDEESEPPPVAPDGPFVSEVLVVPQLTPPGPPPSSLASEPRASAEPESLMETPDIRWWPDSPASWILAHVRREE